MKDLEVKTSFADTQVGLIVSFVVIGLWCFAMIGMAAAPFMFSDWFSDSGVNAFYLLLIFLIGPILAVLLFAAVTIANQPKHRLFVALVSGSLFVFVHVLCVGSYLMWCFCNWT